MAAPIAAPSITGQIPSFLHRAQSMAGPWQCTFRYPIVGEAIGPCRPLRRCRSGGGGSHEERNRRRCPRIRISPNSQMDAG